MQMARDKEIGQVEVQKTENQILFTDKDETAIYKTGMMPDPDLTQRLLTPGPNSPERSFSRPTRC